MNDLALIIAFAVLAVGIIASRVISERAFRKLDDAAKIRVMNEFSGMRIWSVIPVVAILLVAVGGETWFPGISPLMVFGIYLVGLIAYFTAMHILVRKKMIRAGAPEEYISTFMKSRWISYLSLFAMIVVIIGGSVIKVLSKM